MSSKAEYLHVGCVGKLPFDREHLRVNLTARAARIFDEWIHAGRHSMMLPGEGDEGGSDSRAEEVREWRFLLNDEAAGDLLAGVIRPSADLERRTYPFAVFVAVSRSLYGRHYALLPVGLEPVWSGIDDICGILSTAVTRAAFHELISDATVPAPLPQKEARETYEAALSEQADRLLERKDDANLSAQGNAWGELVPQLKKSLGKGSAGVRLGLPVSRQLGGASTDVSFWLDLLNRQFLMKRLEPSVFVDATSVETDRDVLLVFGKLTPDDYPGIMGGAPARTEVFWPTRALRGSEATPQTPPEPVTFSELLSRKYTTLF